MSKGQWMLILILGSLSAVLLFALIYFQLREWLFVLGLVYGLFGVWYTGGLNGRYHAEKMHYQAESIEIWGIFLIILSVLLVAGFLDTTFGSNLWTNVILLVCGSLFLGVHFYTKHVAFTSYVPPRSLRS